MNKENVRTKKGLKNRATIGNESVEEVVAGEDHRQHSIA